MLCKLAVYRNWIPASAIAPVFITMDGIYACFSGAKTGALISYIHVAIRGHDN
jgi:hypothetical protein